MEHLGVARSESLDAHGTAGRPARWTGAPPPAGCCPTEAGHGQPRLDLALAEFVGSTSGRPQPCGHADDEFDPIVWIANIDTISRHRRVWPLSCVGDTSDLWVGIWTTRPPASCLNRDRKSSTSRRKRRRKWVVLAGRGGHHLGDERRQGVGGVAVKGMPRSVIAAGRARVGVSSGILDVAQRDPSVQCERHHRVPQAVRGDVLSQPGPSSQPRHDRCSVVAVQPASAVRDQQRAIGAAAERRTDCADGLRGQRHQRALAALANHREDPIGARHQGRRHRPRTLRILATRSRSRQARAWSRAEVACAAARNRTASSRSSPSVWESRATKGRRTGGSGGVLPPGACRPRCSATSGCTYSSAAAQPPRRSCATSSPQGRGACRGQWPLSVAVPVAAVP
jgi:hypothetical protein